MPYATVAQALDYHEARLTSEAWSALSETSMAAALQDASDAMDLYAAASGGWAEDYTLEPIPEALVRACSLEALALTDPDLSLRRSLMMQGVKSTSIGSASESYSEGAGHSTTALLSPQAAQLIRPYLRRNGSGVPIL